MAKVVALSDEKLHVQVPVRLVANDANWAVGTGPEVTGRAVDLLLLLANRAQAVAYLSGPGLSALL